ncbi:hypothetical protein K469DRAFT_702926 [Zopfia rhizophila CBS 207.26]|uniref:Uncharacterized protein n=1 Tax=Zopfia rhizophila CBS 207.26 TaxID=1314779 RepID=A0A6A6D9Q5_9PEZI|nr:hypothetical protein K469DRAFT_702926 [Zopfia rhizophila CBS 207.26]
MEGDSTKDHPKDSSTLPNNTASNLSRDVLLRRKHYEKTPSYIAARRDSLYGKIPINHLVPLAFHTTPTLLENVQDVNTVVQDVSEQYKENKSDLFGDWQKYCKVLDSHQRVVATFGMLVLLQPI